MTETGLGSGHPEITLAGWQTDPQLRWSFQHVADLFPTVPIEAAVRPVELPRAERDLGEVTFRDPATGALMTVRELLDATDTDGWVVLAAGRLVAEDYRGAMRPSTRHLVMSVSKSVIGVVVGALKDRGVLDARRRVSDLVPELRGTGYDGATVRHLLDMRSGVRFSEDYLDPEAEVRLLEQAIGWAPRTHPELPDTLYGFLATLEADREHGGVFDYRSCETDVLGWVCERASGTRMADLVSDLVWGPMGAEFAADLAVDRVGAGMFDGGISAAVRDLARFGAVFLDDGRSLGGARVLSAHWIEETLTGDEDTADAFAASSDGGWMPGGMYRNQLWFPSARRDVLTCLGIHGQLVYVDRSAGVVVAKVSRWPTPQHAAKLYGTLAACDAIARELAPAG